MPASRVYEESYLRVLCHNYRTATDRKRNKGSTLEQGLNSTLKQSLLTRSLLLAVLDRQPQLETRALAVG
jgi:hypothetical protein